MKYYWSCIGNNCPLHCVKIVEYETPGSRSGEMKENRCADCGDLLTTEEEIRHGACNSCYAMAVCPEAIAENGPQEVGE